MEPMLFEGIALYTLRFTVILLFSSGPFSAYGWAKSQQIRRDIEYVMSSPIGLSFT